MITLFSNNIYPFKTHFIKKYFGTDSSDDKNFITVQEALPVLNKTGKASSKKGIQSFSGAQNQIMQQYFSCSTNAIICIDITTLGIYGELFLAVDIASRNVVGHCYSSTHITTDQVCETIKEFHRKRNFLPDIRIIHSDRGSIFSNQVYYDFIQSLNITRSRGSSAGHQNQVVERLNRTLKGFIRLFLDTQYKTKKSDPLKRPGYSFQQMTETVQQSIEYYHQRPHKALKGLTPDQMEEAFFLKHQGQHPKDIVLYTQDNQSPTAIQLHNYVDLVAKQWGGDWAAFFLHWNSEQTQFQEDMRAQMKSQSQLLKANAQQARINAQQARINEQQAKQRYEQALLQYNNLYNQNLQLQQKVEALRKLEEHKQRALQDMLDLKMKRRMAKKRDIRQTVSPTDFSHIISLVSGRTGAKERRRLAICLLYLTGLRVSNLLVLQVRNIKELVEKRNTTIPLIKGGEQRFNLRLSAKGKRRLIQFKDDIEVLIRDKPDNAPLFTAAHDFTKHISTDTFERELNTILAKASSQLEKHLRTHSFRATIITELLVSTPIEDVKEVIGHKSISSTLEYKRSRLLPRQVDKILASRDILLDQKPKRKPQNSYSRKKTTQPTNT